MTSVFTSWTNGDDDVTRIGTLSSMDFAFWVSRFISVKEDRSFGIQGDPDIANLISWSCAQVGLLTDTTTSEITATCTDLLTTAEAFDTRGSIVFDTNGVIGVSMAFGDVIYLYNSVYTISRFTVSDGTWVSGALIPGLIY